MTHKELSGKSEGSDRAALTFIREYSYGEFNDKMVFEATADGILVDDYIIVPWDWILRAHRILGTSCDLCDLQKTE